MGTGKKKAGKLKKIVIAVGVLVFLFIIGSFGENEDEAVFLDIEKTAKTDGESTSLSELDDMGGVQDKEKVSDPEIENRDSDILEYGTEQIIYKNLSLLLGTYSWTQGENEDLRGAEITIFYDDAKNLCIYGNSWAGVNMGEVCGIVTDIFDDGGIEYVDEWGAGITIYPTVSGGISVEEHGTLGEIGTTFFGEYQRVTENNENLAALDGIDDEEWTYSYELDEYEANDFNNEENIIGDNIGQYMFAVPNYPYENKKEADKLMKTYEKAMKADIDEFVYLEEIKTGLVIGEEKIHYKKTINEEKVAYRYYGKLNKKNEPEGTGVLLEQWSDYAYEESEYSRYIVTVYYIGGFKNGFKDGYGIEYGRMVDGTHVLDLTLEYEGEFKNGKYSGDGIKYFWANSIAEENIPSDSMEFLYKALTSDSEVDNLFPYYNGNKLITYPIVLSNKRFVGKFKDGELDGKGKEFWPNSSDKMEEGEDYLYLYYDGDFKKGSREGKGTLYFSNGDIQYKGEFKKGRYHGKGILYDKQGNVIHKGKFKYGEVE